MLLQRQLDTQNGTNLFDNAISHFITDAGLPLSEDAKRDWRRMIVDCLELYDKRNESTHSSIVQENPTPDSIKRLNDLLEEIPHQRELKPTERTAFIWALTEYRRRTCGLNGSVWTPNHLLRGTKKSESKRQKVYLSNMLSQNHRIFICTV